MRYSLPFLFILLSTNSYSIFGQLGGRIGQKIVGQDMNGGIDTSGIEDSKDIMGVEAQQHPNIKKFADRCITFSIFSLIFTCILRIFV